MALTPHYGLSYFGGNTPGSLTDDGAKYTGRDRLAVDRMLHALAAGDRHLRPTDSLDAPGTPTADVSTGGSLPGGVTLSYTVTYLDADGLETLPSAEVTVSTPDILEPPGEPTLDEALTGTLSPGLYYYALTALRGDEESVQGTQVSISLIDTDYASVQLGLPAAPAGAVSIQVWRMRVDDVGWTRIAVVAAATTTWTDDGSVPANVNADDPSQQPPATNAGVAIYSVTVTLDTAGAALAAAGTISGWNLYRTETPGAYPSASLVHHVIDAVDPDDAGDPGPPFVASWTDEAEVLLDGIPPLASAQMRLVPFVLDHAGSLPDATAYPDYYPLVSGGQLYVQLGGTWTLLGGSGGSASFVSMSKYGVD